ncbi:MAG: isoprenylcysteine carboxylmethyltransferase family protein [Candidatus Sulfotelmatobacter sp.]
MEQTLRTVGWIACVIYSTIPSFWLLIHPRVEYWRSRRRSPYRILLPVSIAMWVLLAAVTEPWRDLTFFHSTLYHRACCWIPAAALFGAGLVLYKLSGIGFSPAQLGGLPEVPPGHRQQRLVTTGIRGHVRHPVYLGHLCEMLAWSIGTGLAVCWALTALAIITGAVMINMEEKELENRFGEEYRQYRTRVPAVLPKTTL